MIKFAVICIGRASTAKKRKREKGEGMSVNALAFVYFAYVSEL